MLDFNLKKLNSFPGSLLKNGNEARKSWEWYNAPSVQRCLNLQSVTETLSPYSETCYYTHLPLEAFDQVTNGHTRGDSMRVDDDIRRDSFTCERHVLRRRRRRSMNNQVELFGSDRQPNLLLVCR